MLSFFGTAYSVFVWNDIRLQRADGREGVVWLHSMMSMMNQRDLADHACRVRCCDGWENLSTEPSGDLSEKDVKKRLDGDVMMLMVKGEREVCARET